MKPERTLMLGHLRERFLCHLEIDRAPAIMAKASTTSLGDDHSQERDVRDALVSRLLLFPCVAAS